MRKLAVTNLPLYQQLAADIRYRIGTGALKPGDGLPSCRSAAAQWGVNLHTIRHAYRVLADEGLLTVSAGRRATVAPFGEATSPDGGPSGEGLANFLRRVAAEAAALYGVTGQALVREMESVVGAGVPVVAVTECSRSLTESLAAQLRAALDVRTETLLISELRVAPQGVILLSTYFHRREVTRAARRRGLEYDLVRLVPDAELMKTLRSRLDQGGLRAVLLETDAAFGHAVARDIGQALGADVEVIIARDPAAYLRSRPPAVILVSPSNWDRIGDAERDSPDVWELKYEIVREDLVRLAARRGFELRQRQT